MVYHNLTISTYLILVYPFFLFSIYSDQSSKKSNQFVNFSFNILNLLTISGFFLLSRIYFSFTPSIGSSTFVTKVLFVLFILFLLILKFCNKVENNFDLYLFIFIYLLFNILFSLNNFLIIFLIVELVSYLFFFFFLKQIIIKKSYKNFLILYYNIILNFFSSVCFFFFLIIALWFIGTPSLVLSHVFLVSGFIANYDLLILGFLIKIGVVPFFFYKFNFYKFLPLQMLFFYSYTYSIYLIFLFNYSTFNQYSYVFVLYLILTTLYYIYFSTQHLTMREVLFFSSSITFLFLLFLFL